MNQFHKFTQSSGKTAVRWIAGLVLVVLCTCGITARGSNNSAESSPTLTPTLTPYPTASTNKAWTPITKTFSDDVEMVLVPKGCFNMGSTDAQAQAAIAQYVENGFSQSNAKNAVNSEQPMNQMCFDQPFWIDQTDVTQDQFKQLGGVAAKSSHFPGG